MTENEVFDKLQSLLPSGVQFINPYLDEVPVPLGDYAQFNIFNRSNIGWCQQRNLGTTEDDQLMTAYDVERVYSIQIDFYGPNAFDNAGVFQQTLQQNLVDDEGGELDLKTIGAVENRTFLAENKKYQRRYGFDLEVFVIDTITKASPYFDTIQYQIVNRGNNF